MLVKTNLIGAEDLVEVADEQIFAFEPGIGGFDALRRYALLSEPDSPVEWLQSLDDQDICFAVMEPFVFDPDYAFELPDRDVEALGMSEAGDALVRCILTLDDDPARITANLLAPLILCRRTHLARQVVLQDMALPLRAPIFSDAEGAPTTEASEEPDEGPFAATA